MPRVKMFNEQEALEKAMLLFWEKGYTATSLADLTQGMGISKGSFYDTFHGKRELFEKVFELYRLKMVDRLQDILYSETEVRKGIRKLMTLNLEEAFKDDQHKGCFAANVCSEMGGQDRAIEQILNHHNDRVRQLLSSYLSTDPKIENPDVLANFFLNTLAGMNQEVKIAKDKSKLVGVIDTAMSVI